MPRAGGESDKLGARFEGVWTVDSVLDVLVGRLTSICIEPLENSQGIEFLTTASGGLTFFHSVKRQNIARDWSLYDLTKNSVRMRSRSILGDLIDKLSTSPRHQAVFVSSTGANYLRELSERALRSLDVDSFERHLASSAELVKQYHAYVLPLFDGRSSDAFAFLRRLRVVLINESELIHRVEDRCEALFSVPAGLFPNWETSVRLHLGEIIIDRLGQELTAPALLEALKRTGVDLTGLRSSAPLPMAMTEAGLLTHSPTPMLARPDGSDEVGDPSTRFHYWSRSIQFVGRQEELEDLRDFVNDTRTLLWWLLTGPAGSGKSRIALELCRSLEDNWETGFLPLTAGVNNWDHWQPQRPTVIVC